MMKYRSGNPKIEALADELFTAIQEAQGRAFVSDGEWQPSEPEFFARIRGRLRWSEISVKIMRDFLRKHDQLPKVGRSIRAGPSLIERAPPLPPETESDETR